MTQTPVVILLAFLAGSSPPDDVLRARAHIDGRIERGSTAQLVVEIDVKDGWSIDKAGVTNAIVQAEVPDCVRLVGERAKTIKALARAGFIRGPEEQLAESSRTVFPFEVTSDCGQSDQFAINVLGYVSPPDGADAWFVRRRLMVAVADKAISHEADASTSNWGVGRELQLGEKAPLMALPRADGTMVDLDQQLGKKNIVITTYRAYW